MAYPPERKIEILTYARDNGENATAHHFNIPTETIREWNKELKIYKRLQRSFTDEQKLEILNYARDHGVVKASDKYDVGIKSIYSWNKKFHVYEERKAYTPAERKKILKFAQENGLVAAEREFNVPGNTILDWNKEYKIYTPRRIVNCIQYSTSEQIEFLNLAKQLYDSLPSRVRSANIVFKELASQHPITVDQLTAWNKKYKIVPSRKYKKTNISQDAIDAAQAALTAARGSVMRAARESGIPRNMIMELKKNKKISFVQASTQIRTNPPVGHRKANAISKIIQMLQFNAKTNPKK